MAKARKFEEIQYSEKLKQAIASSKLEGLSLPEEDLYDIHLVQQGKISEEEAIRRHFQRS